MIFIEDPIFARARAKLLTENEFLDLQLWLMAHPDSGDIIVHSGGCRKVRWAAKGHGKSGGARVIYFHRVSASEIILLEIFSKNQKADLSATAIKTLKGKIK